MKSTAAKKQKKEKVQMWNPYKESHPNHEKEQDLRVSESKVDYEKAIQNLTDILEDSEKFDSMNRNLFMAMDEDGSGVLQCE